MGCRVEKVNNTLLEQYITQYGATEGIKMFLDKDNIKEEPKFLLNPKQQSMDFNEDINKESEKLKRARVEWEQICDKKYDVSSQTISNTRLGSQVEALTSKYKNLKFTVKPNTAKGYYNVTVHNPDPDYYKKDIGKNGLPQIPRFLLNNPPSSKSNPIGEVVNRRMELVRLLKNKLNDIGRNSDKAPAIKAEISRLEKSIQDIQDKNTIKAVLDVGNTQAYEISNKLKDIKELLSNSDLNSDTLKQIIDTNVEIKQYIDTWKDLTEIFDVQIEEDYIDEFSSLVGKYSGLYNTNNALMQNAFLKYVNKESYSNNFTKAMFEDAVDTSWGTKNFYGTDVSNSILVKIANDIMLRAINKTSIEYQDKAKIATQEFKDLLKHTGKSKLQTFDMFMQRRKDGSKTGNLITKYTQEYYDELKELSSELKSKKISYSQWFAKVSNMQYRITKDIVDNNDTTHFTQEEINLQKEKLEKYKQDYDAYKQSLEDSGQFDIDENDIDHAGIEREMIAWEAQRSPYIYWEKIKNADFRNMPKFELLKEYLIMPKAKEKYHDLHFKNVMSDPKLAHFYDYLTSSFKENNSEFPDDYNANQPNYLPELNKRFLEELQKDKGLSILKGLPQAMLDAITIQSDSDRDTRVIINGKIVKSIPITMMSDKLNPEEKSMDLEAILLAHTAMSLNYKHKNNILPIVTATQDLLDEMTETALSHSGDKYKVNKFGMKVNLGKKLNNTKEHLQHTIDTWMYGESKDTLFTASKGMFLTKEEKAEKAELQNKLKKGEITSEEYDSKVANLGKKLSGDQIGDSLIRLTYLKALSFPNVVSPTVNMFFGVLSNLSYAAGGKDFTDKEIFKATGIMLKSISKTIGGKLHMQSVEKVYAWMEKLNLLGQINESMYGREKTIADKAVILQMKGETINQGSVMVAMLMNKKVKDLQGKEVSLWNAYKIVNGELQWDTERFGEQPESLQHEIQSGNAINLERLGFQIKNVVKRIHGDYMQPMAVKRTIIGRVFMLFRTWLPASLKERFGSLEYNQYLDRDVKGRYISIFSAKDGNSHDVNLGKSMADFAKLILTQNFLLKGLSKKTLQGYSDVDVENLKRAAREAQIILAVTMVTLMLKSLHSDDDDEKKAINMLVNTLGKTNADLMFFFNPGAMMNVASNPIPILKTANEFGAIIPMTYQTIMGNARYENGPWEGHLRYEKWLWNNMPIGGAAYAKMVSLADKQYGYQ